MIRAGDETSHHLDRSLVQRFDVNRPGHCTVVVDGASGDTGVVAVDLNRARSFFGFVFSSSVFSPSRSKVPGLCKHVFLNLISHSGIIPLSICPW